MEYGCIGEHLPHSFSKEIHNIFETYDYRLNEIEPRNLPRFMERADFKAINVTIPYKQAVIPYLSWISEQAKAIGAVNTVVNRGGKLYGYNTDFMGMDALFRRLGIDPKGEKVLILGSGGTSKTARALMQYRGAREIYRVSRSKKEDSLSYEEAAGKHSDAGIIINTTPSGMFPDSNSCPIDLSLFPRLFGAVDAVYNPLRTEFVQEAIKRGAAAEGGLYMLVAQAVYASEYFTGKKFAEDLPERVFKKIRSDKENIVITGMSGAGKSEVGKALRRITGRKLYDTDALIVSRAGMPITEIFRQYGEAYFRDLETAAIRTLENERGVIISTGGGAILREANVRSLKKNGRLFFLERNIEEILPTGDRPLADTRDKVDKLYRERLPLYLRTADTSVKVTGTPEHTAETLLRARLKA